MTRRQQRYANEGDVVLFNIYQGKRLISNGVKKRKKSFAAIKL
jgi:hypothetical protein